MFHQIGCIKDESPLGVKDSLEDRVNSESKTLIEIVKTLGITTTKGEHFKRYSSMIKKLKEVGFPIIDLPKKDITKMNLQLKILPSKSNAIVSSYKSDELGRSVDPSNKNVKRYSKQDFTTQQNKEIDYR